MILFIKKRDTKYTKIPKKYGEIILFCKNGYFVSRFPLKSISPLRGEFGLTALPFFQLTAWLVDYLVSWLLG